MFWKIRLKGLDQGGAFMHLAIGIIAAVVIFGVLVAVHEGGHFMTAKAVGVRVNEF